MIRTGLLDEMDQAKLPNLKNIDPNYMDKSFDPGNKYTVPYMAGTDAIAVNTETVDNVPTSWADLWKPEYAGRMVFIDDSRVIIGMTLMTLGYSPNTTDPAELEEAKAKLQELIPNVKLFDSDSPKTALIAGDVDLGVVWTGEAFEAHENNEAIEYVYPSEGAFFWQDNWAMPKGAPHPDAAYAWINYTLQGNIFWMVLQDFPYINPNKAALEFAKTEHPDLYSAYMDSPITNTPADVIQKSVLIEDVGEALPLYDEIWIEVKGE
jgi:spermidine/putrescine-binding protein